MKKVSYVKVLHRTPIGHIGHFRLKKTLIVKIPVFVMHCFFQMFLGTRAVC